MLSVGRGEHVCLFYEKDPGEQLPLLIPFVQEGLEAGEQCVWIADDYSVAGLTAALTEGGIDVVSETERGSLKLWTRAEWRQPGELDSDSKSAQVRDIVQRAVLQGFTGARFAVEMTWTLDPETDIGRLRHWESTLNRILTPAIPARMVCQYNRSRLSPDAIYAALSSHPTVVIGTHHAPNPYFDGPLVPRVTSAPVAGSEASEGLMASRLMEIQKREREFRVEMEAAVAQAQLAQAKAEELQKVAEEASVALQSANESKDMFLALVSHEMRTPLTTIAGNADLLFRRYDTLPAEQRKECLQDLKSESERLRRLIENMLLVSRVEQTELELEPVLLQRIAGVVVERHRTGPLGREVFIDEEERLPMVLGNRACIEQIIENLVSNARKYSAHDAPIELRMGASGRSVELTVADRGRGFGSAEPIFDAFYRSPDAALRRPGLGLGLSVCKRLVDLQGGTIRGKQREGGGAEFTFSLPAVAESDL